MYSAGCAIDHAGNGEIEDGAMGAGIPTRHLLQTVQRELLTPWLCYSGFGLCCYWSLCWVATLLRLFLLMQGPVYVKCEVAASGSGTCKIFGNLLEIGVICGVV